MIGWQKWLWGGLGWAIGGPIGAIIGFALGALTEEKSGLKTYRRRQKTSPGDFGSALIVLFAAMMKADGKVLKSELDFVKNFFNRQFGEQHTLQRLQLLKKVLQQDYSIDPVCLQIRQNMDYASRLELIHLLFGLANSDGELHASEEQFLQRASDLLHIKPSDFFSLKAMFVKSRDAAYKMLEIPITASDEEVKKAYRSMAKKYHPDRVHHLGPEFQKDAQEKFKKVRAAYDQIKKERNM